MICSLISVFVVAVSVVCSNGESTPPPPPPSSSLSQADMTKLMAEMEQIMNDPDAYEAKLTNVANIDELKKAVNDTEWLMKSMSTLMMDDVKRIEEEMKTATTEQKAQLQKELDEVNIVNKEMQDSLKEFKIYADKVKAGTAENFSALKTEWDAEVKDMSTDIQKGAKQGKKDMKKGSALVSVSLMVVITFLGLTALK